LLADQHVQSAERLVEHQQFRAMAVRRRAPLDSHAPERARSGRSAEVRIGGQWTGFRVVPSGMERPAVGRK
jgi:hypothetical protein